MGKPLIQGLNSKSGKTAPRVGEKDGMTTRSMSGEIIRDKQLDKSRKVHFEIHPHKVCNRTEFTTGLLYKPRPPIRKTPMSSKKLETAHTRQLKKRLKSSSLETKFTAAMSQSTKKQKKSLESPSASSNNVMKKKKKKPQVRMLMPPKSHHQLHNRAMHDPSHGATNDS